MACICLLSTVSSTNFEKRWRWAGLPFCSLCLSYMLPSLPRPWHVYAALAACYSMHASLLCLLALSFCLSSLNTPSLLLLRAFTAWRKRPAELRIFIIFSLPLHSFTMSPAILGTYPCLLLYFMTISLMCILYERNEKS